jgi:hypothetical protein
MMLTYGQLPEGARPAFSWPKYSLVGSVAVVVDTDEINPRRQGRRSKALIREQDLAFLREGESDLITILYAWTRYLNG